MRLETIAPQATAVPMGLTRKSIGVMGASLSPDKVVAVDEANVFLDQLYFSATAFVGLVSAKIWDGTVTVIPGHLGTYHLC
jgi:hypothetical protein